MKNSRLKRTAALAAIVLIAAMYVAALLFSFSGNELGQTLFRAALGCTMIVPVLIYLMMMVARLLTPKKSPVIDALVFDIGNVLVEFPWSSYTAGLDLSEEAKSAIFKMFAETPLWRDLDLGIRPYDDVIDDFCSQLPEYSAEIRHILTHVPESMQKFWFTDDLIRGLKAHGYKVYYLSNWGRDWHDALIDSELSFTKNMDGGIFSYAVHLAKPDSEIFDLLSERYRLNPNRTLFIDDTKVNTDAARKLGFSAVTFTGYNDLIEKLESVGVIL